MKSSFSGCRSQVAPLEGEGGQEMRGKWATAPVTDEAQTPQAQPGRDAPQKEARRKLGVRCTHPPAQGRGRQGPLTENGAHGVASGDCL